MNPQEIPQTQKTPEAYDLSKVEDLWKLSNGLTLNERKALREKFVQEKEAIIYLTQSELTELQTTLVSENNQHSDRVERVASFLESQKSEGLSLSDMMENNTEISSELKSVIPEIESEAQEFLFGANGYMKQFDLSKSSQDSVSLGFSLFILETFAGGEYDMETLRDPNNISIFADIETQFQVLREISDIRITGQGEKNTVLLDPLQAKEIFTKLVVEEADAHEIKAYIEGGNLNPREDDSITALDTSKISDFSRQQLLLLQEKIIWKHENGEKNTTESDVSQDTELPDTETFQDMPPEEQQSLIEQLKAGNFLEKIFASILEALQNIGLYTETRSETKSDDTPSGTESSSNTKNTPNETELSVNGKKIAIKHAWVQEQIGNVVQDTQKPTQTEILGILKQFQNSDFSNPKNQPENSAQAIYALQVALSNQWIDLGDIDGVFGPKTQEGIKQYQKNLGLSETGKIDETLFSTLIKKIVPETPEK